MEALRCEQGISNFTVQNMLVYGLCFIMMHTDSHWVHFLKNQNHLMGLW